MNFYITITGINHYFGKEVFQIGQKLFLFKEPNNKFDDEAIKVCARAITVIKSENENGDDIIIKLPHFERVGYIANSTKTVYKGTMSSGRIYDKVPNSFTAKVMFITHTSVIAKVSLEISDMFNTLFNTENLTKSLEENKNNLSQIEKLDTEIDELAKNLSSLMGDSSNSILDFNKLDDIDLEFPELEIITEDDDDDDDEDIYSEIDDEIQDFFNEDDEDD